MRLVLLAFALSASAEARFVSTWVKSTYSPLTGAWKRVIETTTTSDSQPPNNKTTTTSDSQPSKAAVNTLVDSFSGLEEVITLLSTCKYLVPPSCSLLDVSFTEDGPKKIFVLTFKTVPFDTSTDKSIVPASRQQHADNSTNSLSAAVRAAVLDYYQDGGG